MTAAHRIENSKNFRRVDDRVTTSGIVTPAQLTALAQQGYQALIDLLPDGHPEGVVGEREIVEGQGVQYHRIPVDFAHPTVADFERFTAVMDELADLRIHIHCAANYRVSAFYALYAERVGWWTTAAADQFVAGVWNPAEHAGWPEFIAAVRSERRK